LCRQIVRYRIEKPALAGITATGASLSAHGGSWLQAICYEELRDCDRSYIAIRSSRELENPVAALSSSKNLASVIHRDEREPFPAKLRVTARNDANRSNITAGTCSKYVDLGSAMAGPLSYVQPTRDRVPARGV
jgi:hypothetical protein